MTCYGISCQALKPNWTQVTGVHLPDSHSERAIAHFAVHSSASPSAAALDVRQMYFITSPLWNILSPEGTSNAFWNQATYQMPHTAYHHNLSQHLSCPEFSLKHSWFLGSTSTNPYWPTAHGMPCPSTEASAWRSSKMMAAFGDITGPRLLKQHLRKILTTTYQPMGCI